MFKKYVLGLGVFVLAIAILTISVMRSSSVSYAFATPTPSPNSSTQVKTQDVNYNLPFPGSVLPGSPLWDIKALRDKVWYLTTPSPLKKAELALLFSDKRLSASVILLNSQKTDLSITTLSKGEKYLEIAASEEEAARKAGYDTSHFLTQLALASLKHRQVIEEEIIPRSPESARPDVVKIEDYSKNSYKIARDALNSKGNPTPTDPFDGK